MIIETIEELKAASNATILYVHEDKECWGITWDYGRQQWWMILERTEHNDWYDEPPQWLIDQLPELKVQV